MEWWKRAFETWYPVVYAKRDDASATVEVAWAIDALELRSGSRVLDLACGGGRHARALHAKGFDVVGCDQSLTLIREALRRGGGPAFVVADQRSLPFLSAAFEAVTCFFTSFGYGDGPEHDVRILRETARVLRPGGCFLLDLPDKCSVVEGLVAHGVERREGVVIESWRRWTGTRVEKDVSVRRETGEPLAQWTESVLLYDHDQIRAMLAAAEFDVMKTASAFGSGTDRMILTSRRR